MMGGADGGSENQVLVIKPTGLGANRRVEVAAVEDIDSKVPGAITFSFRGSITNEDRAEIRALITRQRAGILLEDQCEFPDQRAIRVRVDPAFVATCPRSGVEIASALLQGIEESEALVQSLNCVLLEASDEVPPPALMPREGQSLLARLTNALYRPFAVRVR
jgi:hypothetical protein